MTSPGSPLCLEAKKTLFFFAAGCTVLWLGPPSQLLSSPDAAFIQGYNIEVVQKSPAKVFPLLFNNGSASTSTLVSGLLPKHDYTVTVTTLSKDGRKIPSAATVFQTRSSGARPYHSQYTLVEFHCAHPVSQCQQRLGHPQSPTSPTGA